MPHRPLHTDTGMGESGGKNKLYKEDDTLDGWPEPSQESSTAGSKLEHRRCHGTYSENGGPVTVTGTQHVSGRQEMRGG